MTDVTVKVLPKAETEAKRYGRGPRRCARLRGQAATMGSHAMSRARRIARPCGVLFSTACRSRKLPPCCDSKACCLRSSIAGDVAALMKPFGPVALLDGQRFARALAQRAAGQTISPPTRRATGRCGGFHCTAKGHAIAAAITPAAQMFYDWAGGLIWVAMPFADGAGRRLDPRRGGEPWRPCYAGARTRLTPRFCRRVRAAGRTPARLSKRVKEGFDPNGVAQSRPHVGGGCRSMQTNFTLAQLAVPQKQWPRKKSCALCALRLLPPRRADLCAVGDELDSPRGRIYLIKELCPIGRIARRRVRWSNISTVACRACPA